MLWAKHLTFKAGVMLDTLWLLLIRTIDSFLSLTLTQQSLIIVATFLSLTAFCKVFSSLFWVYSLVVIISVMSIIFCDQNPSSLQTCQLWLFGRRLDSGWFKTQKFVLGLIEWIKSISEQANIVNEPQLDLETQLAIFLSSFTAEFVDTWFDDIAAEPTLRDKIHDVVARLVNDLNQRVAELDPLSISTSLFHAYNEFLFQRTEAAKSMRVKSLYDSSKRAKKLRCIEHAFDANFGLHPVVKYLMPPLLPDSTTFHHKCSRNRHTSRRRSALLNCGPLDSFHYFYALLSLIFDLQYPTSIEECSSQADFQPSQISREFLSDVVTKAGILPLLPKLTDPAFLYECVCDLLAPPDRIARQRLAREEAEWNARNGTNTRLRSNNIFADSDQDDASSITSSAMRDSVDFPPLDFTSIQDSIHFTSSMTSNLTSMLDFDSRRELGSLSNTDDDFVPKNSSSDFGALPCQSNDIVEQLLLEASTDEDQPTSNIPYELEANQPESQENNSNLQSLSQPYLEMPASLHFETSPPFLKNSITNSKENVLQSGSYDAPLNKLSLSQLKQKQTSQQLPIPKFTFSQFDDFVDVSLFSTSALTAFQEEALNAVLGDDEEDEEFEQTRVEVTSPSSQFSHSPTSSNKLISEATTNCLDAILVIPASPPLSSICDGHGQKKSLWNSCPDLSMLAADDLVDGDIKDRTGTQLDAEYDCFSVGECPAKVEDHFNPAFFMPSPEITCENGESPLTSSGSSTPMDRLFQSVMIPDTNACRDPHSGIKFTLYVIHFTAVYPCGLGGTLEPRVGVVKRRFREFLTLHERLENSNVFKFSLKGIKGPSKWSGPFPWTNMDKDLIEGRRKSLECYLKSLVALSDICCSQPLREFLAYDADPRIAFVQKAPNYANLFRLDRFFTKGLRGSIGQIGGVLTTSSLSTAIITPQKSPQIDSRKAAALTEVPISNLDYHPTGSKDVYLKGPLLRGKDLSASSTPRSGSPVTVLGGRSPGKEGGGTTNLSKNLALALGAGLVLNEEDLVKKGVLDVDFGNSAMNQSLRLKSSQLHVPYGPHFRWGLRGKKEQDSLQHYFKLRPHQGYSGHRPFEKQCEVFLSNRSKNKDCEIQKDLDDLLLPPKEEEELFLDALEDLEPEEQEDVEAKNSLIDSLINILGEATRSRPCWINYELLLFEVKRIFGPMINCIIAKEVKEAFTRPRWAYYLGLLRLVIWHDEASTVQSKPISDSETALAKRQEALNGLMGVLPNVILKMLGFDQVQSALDVVFDSVDNPNLNLHFILNALELLLQELYPEINFTQQLETRINALPFDPR